MTKLDELREELMRIDANFKQSVKESQPWLLEVELDNNNSAESEDTDEPTSAECNKQE